jgi:tetratricopeptide (TPR) repeat protein
MGNLDFYVDRLATDQLLNGLRKALKSPADNPLIFHAYGIGGIGKTSLTKKIARDFPDALVVSSDIGAEINTETPLKLMDKIYRQLPDLYDWREEFSEKYGQYQEVRRSIEQDAQGKELIKVTQSVAQLALTKMAGEIVKYGSQSMLDAPGTIESFEKFLAGFSKTKGKVEEKVDNQAITIKPDEPQYFHNKGCAYFMSVRYPEAINCFEQSMAIKPDKYDSWHDKGLVQFVTSDYAATLATWQQTFRYISDPAVPRYYKDISGLIQEFIEELIPRLAQTAIQQTLLIPLLSIYQEANVITELGAALVNTLDLIVAPNLSDHTASQWLALWQTSSLGQEPTMELPLRLMATAIEYKKDPSKRDRLWLNLPSEERPILNKALKLAD